MNNWTPLESPVRKFKQDYVGSEPYGNGTDMTQNVSFGAEPLVWDDLDFSVPPQPDEYIPDLSGHEFLQNDLLDIDTPPLAGVYGQEPEFTGEQLPSQEQPFRHKREFSETLSMNAGPPPLVNLAYNDDMQNPSLQTPVRGSQSVAMHTPYIEAHHAQSSPNFFMHELQSPLESPALQSPTVAFPNYPIAASGSSTGSGGKPGIRRLMTSPRVQRGMSSASQMNSPSLGDIAEAPSETSPQTPKVKSKGTSHRESASSGSFNGKQATPRSSAAAAAAAASMGFPPASQPDESPKVRTTTRGSGSPVRSKRESHRRVTQDQIDILEREFETNMRPDVAERERIAAAISLDISEVSSWFNKRRLKDRDQAESRRSNRAAASAAASAASTTPGRNQIQSPSGRAGSETFGPPIASPMANYPSRMMPQQMPSQMSQMPPQMSQMPQQMSQMPQMPPQMPQQMQPQMMHQMPRGSQSSVPQLPMNQMAMPLGPQVSQRPRLGRSTSHGFHQQLVYPGEEDPPDQFYGAGKRRSLQHGRTSSSMSSIDRPFGSCSDYSSSSTSLSGFATLAHQRSSSLQDKDNVVFNSAYSSGHMPFGPPSRSNSLASVNSMAMFPPSQEPLEPRKDSPMRWPPHPELTRSQSMVSVDAPLDFTVLPTEMKRRRSLYGTAVPTLRSLDAETTPSSSRAASPHVTGSLASSAAAAALRSSARRSTPQQPTRSRQSSIRLQLEENNHTAQLVLYSEDDSPGSPAKSSGHQPTQHSPH